MALKSHFWWDYRIDNIHLEQFRESTTVDNDTEL